MPGDVVVKIENLSFTYSSGERAALSNINLEIQRGEFVAVNRTQQQHAARAATVLLKQGPPGLAGTV